MTGFFTIRACTDPVCEKERLENSPLPITTVIYEFNYFCRACSTYWRIEVHFSGGKRARCPCCGYLLRTKASHNNKGSSKWRRKQLQRKIDGGSMEIETVVFEQAQGYRQGGGGG